jgi:hypothetical protein
LNRLTSEAEAWAESGEQKIGERPVRCERPKPGALRREVEQTPQRLFLAA